jgi:hypothetical protein
VTVLDRGDPMRRASVERVHEEIPTEGVVVG